MTKEEFRLLENDPDVFRVTRCRREGVASFFVMWDRSGKEPVSEPEYWNETALWVWTKSAGAVRLDRWLLGRETRDGDA